MAMTWSTNTDIAYYATVEAPLLTLEKAVINDNGGPLNVGNFTLHVSGGAYDGSVDRSSGESVVVQPGVLYEVSEDAEDGYEQVGIECKDDDTGALVAHPVTFVDQDPPQHVTCTITNDDMAPSLTLVKEVINDNGGTALTTDWTLTATGYDSENPQTGTYDLSESGGPDGYTLTSLKCSNSGDAQVTSVTLSLGEDVTCTFVNDDDAPSLTLFKEVINDNGGTAVAGEWTLTATGYDPVSPDAGTYDLSESGGPDGYTMTSLKCSNSGDNQVTSVTLGLGEDVTCTFVNDDMAPSLTLVKEVVDNVSDTPMDAIAWTLSADGPTPISGDGGTTSDASFKAGTYTLSETGPGDHTASAWVCEGGSQLDETITLDLGESATCTIINTRETGTLEVIKQISGRDLGRSWNVDISGPTSSGWSLLGGNPETTSTLNVATGTYSITETGTPDIYFEAQYACTVNGVDDVSGEGTTFDIDVNSGDEVICTITNEYTGPNAVTIRGMSAQTQDIAPIETLFFVASMVMVGATVIGTQRRRWSKRR